MSAKSKPSTARHAELSKISETSSRALMRSNLTAVVRDGSGCHLPEQAADQTTGGVGQVVDHVRDRIQRVGRTATVPAALGRRLVRRPARGRPVSRGTVPGFEPPEGAPPPGAVPPRAGAGAPAAVPPPPPPTTALPPSTTAPPPSTTAPPTVPSPAVPAAADPPGSVPASAASSAGGTAGETADSVAVAGSPGLRPPESASAEPLRAPLSGSRVKTPPGPVDEPAPPGPPDTSRAMGAAMSRPAQIVASTRTIRARLRWRARRVA